MGGRDGRRRCPAAEELQRIVLVLAQDLELYRACHRGQPGQRPGVQRVAVDHQREAGVRVRIPRLQFIGEVCREHFELPGEPHHGLAGVGQFDGPRPPQHGPADGDLERADALAHGGGSDGKVAGGGVETPLRDDGSESPRLIRMDVNH
ncbi:hypothetical protein D9M72_429030 [compost metagenome]